MDCLSWTSSDIARFYKTPQGLSLIKAFLRVCPQINKAIWFQPFLPMLPYRAEEKQALLVTTASDWMQKCLLALSETLDPSLWSIPVKGIILGEQGEQRRSWRLISARFEVIWKVAGARAEGKQREALQSLLGPSCLHLLNNPAEMGNPSSQRELW